MMMEENYTQNFRFTNSSFGDNLLKELSLIICVIISLVFIALDVSSSKKLDSVKMSFYNLLAPVLSTTTKIGNVMDDFFLNFNTLSELNKKIDYLSKENAEMQFWKNKAVRFEAENQSLKELLKYSDNWNYNFVSSRIAIDNSSSFNRSVVIEAKNLKENQSVMSKEGLVGRITKASDDFANVLLITDIDSRVPVVVERTREKGIIFGQDSNVLTLNYLANKNDVTVGDRIVTSGDGGVFLPGLLVGRVSFINNDKVEIIPSTNFNRLEFVSALTTKKERLE